MAEKTTRYRLPLSQAAPMVYQYARRAVADQGRAVAFLVLYLVAVLVLVFRSPVPDPVATAVGVVAVVLGLAFFLQGLLLGIMPLGETCGTHLPSRTPLVVMLLLAFLLGLGATYAEPAVVALRAAGQRVDAWEAPLLFYLLNTKSEMLMLAVGVGVGFAVLTSMLRFLYRWSLKPFLLVVVVAVLALTAWCATDPLVATVVGLAWDTGGITTGPVTVPLVVALGLGVARSSGGEEQGISGLGVVTLASLLPVAAVLGLALALRPEVPEAMAKDRFFAPEERPRVTGLFRDERSFKAYLAAHLDPARAVEDLGGAEAAHAFLEELAAADRSGRGGARPPMPLVQLLESRLGPAAVADLRGVEPGGALARVAARHARVSVQAVLPLSLFLALVLLAILRVRLRRMDEMLLGVLFSLVGMALFSFGVGTGLTRLGEAAGRSVPASFMSVPRPEQATVIAGFDSGALSTAVRPDGSEERFFYLLRDGVPVPVEFDPRLYDAATRSYTYVPREGPVVGPGRAVEGILLALLIVFLMGYGATLAEPALTSLGLKLEELSVGTFRRVFLVRAVAVGVGIGLGLGFARIVWDLPLVWLLAAGYGIALILSLSTGEGYVSIAWDSAGVTTGPITVPLVVALGLGIGGQTGAVESFGIIALASLCPILSVLLAVKWLERRSVSRLREG